MKEVTLPLATVMMKFAIFVVVLTLSGAALACPMGYVPCGETGQLSCPIGQ